jgi:hypothetical protein
MSHNWIYRGKLSTNSWDQFGESVQYNFVRHYRFKTVGFCCELLVSSKTWSMFTDIS